MTQADIETQLKVWKDLAISKQILMGAATKALGLEPECSSHDLSTALTKAIERAEEADTAVGRMREQTDEELTVMRAKVESSEKALAEIKEQISEAVEAREAAERRLEIGKRDNADALKKAKADVTDKQNEFKAISKALADTPENVIKKLKSLKKQKLEDAKSRSRIEAQLQNTRKEKAKIEQELEQQSERLEQVSALAETMRELHALCEQANEKIGSLSEDENDRIDVPELDEALLDSVTGKAAEEDQHAEA